MLPFLWAFFVIKLIQPALQTSVFMITLIQLHDNKYQVPNTKTELSL